MSSRPLPASDPDAGLPPAAAVVLAGGSGSRVGADRNKVLLELAGLPVLAHSLRVAAGLADVRRVVVVSRREDLEHIRVLAAAHAPGADVVEGGADRAGSERAAFTVLADDVATGRIALIAVHDGARPLASPALWRTVLSAAAEHGGALPARDLGPTLALPGAGVRAGLHEDLVGVSTPQAFAAAPLLEVYAAAAADGFAGTDTASFIERYGEGLRIAAVPDEPENLKVTWPGDLDRAERILRG